MKVHVVNSRNASSRTIIKETASRKIGVSHKAFKTARGALGHARRCSREFLVFRPYDSTWVLRMFNTSRLVTCGGVKVAEDADTGAPLILFSTLMKESTMHNIARGYCMALDVD